MIIEGILEIGSKESDHPRTYEVDGNLIKQEESEVTEKLGDLQEKMGKKLKEVPNTDHPRMLLMVHCLLVRHLNSKGGQKVRVM